MAEDIQRDPTQVELVRNRGQVLFCWTDDQNNPEIVKYLKNLGVDGIIYDRLVEWKFHNEVLKLNKAPVNLVKVIKNNLHFD